MTQQTRRALKEGAGFGVIAGILLGIVEIISAALSGDPPLSPLRYASSIVLGSAGLGQVPFGTAVLVGLITHLALSALFGCLYGLISARSSVENQTSWSSQAAMGLAFGALLWLVNVHFVARLFYSWFLQVPQLPQLLMHTLFYGLPLASMYAGSERRLRHVPAAPNR